LTNVEAAEAANIDFSPSHKAYTHRMPIKKGKPLFNCRFLLEASWCTRCSV